MCKQNIDIIFKRRSVRSYIDKPISNEIIKQILTAGMSGPTACDKKTPEFIVMKKQDVLKKVSSFLPNGGFLAKAPIGILVCGNMTRAHSGELSYMLQDCSAAIENILIAASVLGLGACWLGIHPRPDRLENIAKYFKLPENIIPVSAISLGYPASEPEPRKRYFKEHVHIDAWE